MERAGEIAGIVDPASRVRPAQILHAHLRGSHATQERVTADLLVGDAGGKRLEVERFEFTGDLFRGVMEIEIIGRPVEYNIERLALVEIERLGAENRNMRGPHARCHEVALVA